MLLPFTHELLFGRRNINIICTDTRDNVSDLTTYTFTACHLPPLCGAGQPATGDTWGVTPHVKSKSRYHVAVIVHAEDAAITFGITSVSIGGVAGAEQIDRGGGTNAINTGIYTWRAGLLTGITNTDIVVVMTEAVTGCAIGVIGIDYMGTSSIQSGAAAATGTGAIALNCNITTINGDCMQTAMLAGSTLITGAGSELPSFEVTDQSAIRHPTLLYHISNAEFDYAAAWAPLTQYIGANTTGMANMTVKWSGATAGDAAAVVFI